MKYQSELIKEIVETRGHEKSSLHYESECIEEWIEESKGAYPKLCDYESEWLNYINENPIGVFPYEIITDVTEATVNNVVPFAYQSAILSGQTLVNLINLENFTSSDILYTCDLPIKNNTTYTVIATLRGSDKIRTADKSVFRIKDNNANGNDLINIQEIIPNDISTIINLCQTIKITTQNNLHIRLYNTLPENLKIIILEGDHTQEDIPYFEGVVSVKMPVLTTTGKNLFDGKFIKYNTTYGQYHFGSGTYTYSISDNDTSIDLSNISFGDANGTSSIYWAIDSGRIINTKRTVTNKNIIFYPNNEETFNKIKQRYNIQIEEGSVATEYEPFKSNILSTPEDLELRGIGEVQDTLNCLTGEVVERIGEIELVNREWIKYESFLTPVYGTRIDNLFFDKDGNSMCDKLSRIPYDNRFNIEVGQYYTSADNIYVGYNMSDSEFKSYIDGLSPKLQYQLKTPTIKTVDLSIKDQDGNTLRKIKPIEGTMLIHSNGTPLKPTITMEIPVEATTQNLSSFIKEE